MDLVTVFRAVVFSVQHPLGCVVSLVEAVDYVCEYVLMCFCAWECVYVYVWVEGY